MENKQENNAYPVGDLRVYQLINQRQSVFLKLGNIHGNNTICVGAGAKGKVISGVDNIYAMFKIALSSYTLLESSCCSPSTIDLLSPKAKRRPSTNPTSNLNFELHKIFKKK
jgi:hypothetical protein